MGTRILVNIESGHGLVPDGTKPLIEQVVTNEMAHI